MAKVSKIKFHDAMVPGFPRPHWLLINNIEKGCVCVGGKCWTQWPLWLDSHLLSCAVMTNPQLELHFSLPLALLPCNLHSNEGPVQISLWLAGEIRINQNCQFKKK